MQDQVTTPEITIEVKNPNKRVNIISKQIIDEHGTELQKGGILMRTTRSFAAKCIAAGTHTTTSKSKLKSFLNKSGKLFKNARMLETMIPVVDKTGKIVYEDKSSSNPNEWKPKMELKYNLKDKKQGHQYFQDEYNGKSYVAIKRGEAPVLMQHRDKIDPTTGKPQQYTLNKPVYQFIVVAFNNY